MVTIAHKIHTVNQLSKKLKVYLRKSVAAANGCVLLWGCVREAMTESEWGCVLLWSSKGEEARCNCVSWNEGVRVRRDWGRHKLLLKKMRELGLGRIGYPQVGQKLLSILLLLSLFILMIKRLIYLPNLLTTNSLNSFTKTLVLSPWFDLLLFSSFLMHLHLVLCIALFNLFLFAFFFSFGLFCFSYKNKK